MITSVVVSFSVFLFGTSLTGSILSLLGIFVWGDLHVHGN